MKKLIFALSLCLIASVRMSAGTPDALKIKTFTLDNGMTVWINEDPNQVAVYGAVVVKAGAVDCPGTGIAHYFEHMMFKGTDKIGTIDYAAEKPYLDSISVMYDKLAETSDADEKKAIQMEINRLSIKASDYVIPNEFNNLISEMGGSGLNAFTSYDETVFHNKFLPAYFEQWAELNSERIMNPVFRLFQSELETVYEEKNMGDDELANDFRNVLLKNMYKGTGYTEEIVGTTESLKNPRLGQMREFFEKYYVASNMGLILTGNINESEVRPIIEKTFGRIRKGDPIERTLNVPEPIKGITSVTAKINMPIVRLGAVGFRGPSKTDPDYAAVSFLTSLLNNDAGTGLLDKLMVDHKLMVAMAMPDLSFRDAGSIMVLYMPKLLFQSEKKATSLILGAFDRIKKGDFSDEFFESCKLSYKKMLIAEVEQLDERMQNMAFAFSDGLDWNEIISRPDRIGEMTKDDIIALANKYFGEDYILIRKEKGLAQKEKLQKPDYEKVVPKNRDVSSAYAQWLRKSAEGKKIMPKAVDYENDAQKVQISPLVKLYTVANPYNNVFDLTISFRIGTNEKPALGRAASYVNLLGTDKESFDELHSRLQTMGSAVAFTVSENSFNMSVTGFDENLDETLAIAADILKNVKGDKKKLNEMKLEEKSAVLMNRSDMDALDDALYSKVLYGDKSEYVVDKGEFSDANLLGLFKDVQKVQCDVLYSGTLDAEAVSASLKFHFDVDSVTVPSSAPVDLSLQKQDGTCVFFVNKKGASQSQVREIFISDPADNQKDRYATNLYARYLGGGMSSLLFQEIREFRSMAYSTFASVRKPSFKNRADIPVFLLSYVGTQSDKTIDAMTIMDSLITQTPFVESKLETIKNEMINTTCNEYPDFRSMAYTISSDLNNGYTEDPVKDFIEVVGNADTASVKATWEKYFSGRKPVWCIVGNAKKVDMEGLKQFGPVTELKASDIIK